MKTGSRPCSLLEVAERSASESEFGRNLADFEHELVKVASRKGLTAAIAERPELLADCFETGVVADAWLASYAEELAARHRLNFPEWIWEAERFLKTPYVQDSHSPRLKIWHALKSPVSFSRRNLFVDIVLPTITVRRGRPPVSEAHKRAMNRVRVARHRARKQEDHFSKQ